MINEMIKQLLAIPENVWDSYALLKEPLRNKLTKEQKDSVVSLAHATGRMVAYKVKKEYPGKRVMNIIQTLSLQLKKSTTEYCSAYTMFACYREPDEIEVFTNLIDAAEQLMMDTDSYHLIGGYSILEILLAHELFHYYEFHQKDLPINQMLVPIYRFGIIPCKTKLISIGEIAAMEFTKTLLDLPFSPYLLDVLLLYPQDKDTAYKLYQIIMKSSI